jgi:hypothetical protein
MTRGAARALRLLAVSALLAAQPPAPPQEREEPASRGPISPQGIPGARSPAPQASRGLATRKGRGRLADARFERPRPYDQPDEAQRFFARKRLPPGESLLPVERYLEAREQMRSMRLHSTRGGQGKAVLSSIDVLDSWQPLGPGNVGGRTRAILIDPVTPGTMYAAGVAGGVW